MNNEMNNKTVGIDSNDQQQSVAATLTSANFAQIALESPALQVAAIGSKLDQLFSHLTPPDSESEKKYRLHLFEVKNGYKHSRFAFGEALAKYWFWSKNTKAESWKAERKNTFDQLCNLIGMPKRTVYDILADFNRANAVQVRLLDVAREQNIDLAERRHSELVEEMKAYPRLEANDDAAAIFSKAQAHVAAAQKEREEKARLAQQAEARKSNYAKLIEFVADLYEGKPVSDFRRDIEQVVKYLTSYSRADDTVPSLKEAHEKNRAKAA